VDVIGRIAVSVASQQTGPMLVDVAEGRASVDVGRMSDVAEGWHAVSSQASGGVCVAVDA